jgi:hypothetical protein
MIAKIYRWNDISTIMTTVLVESKHFSMQAPNIKTMWKFFIGVVVRAKPQLD